MQWTSSIPFGGEQKLRPDGPLRFECRLNHNMQWVVGLLRKDHVSKGPGPFSSELENARGLYKVELINSA